MKIKSKRKCTKKYSCSINIQCFQILLKYYHHFLILKISQTIRVKEKQVFFKDKYPYIVIICFKNSTKAHTIKIFRLAH